MMTTVFRDRKVVILVDLIERGSTITADVDYKTLIELRREIQNRRRGELSSGVILFHN